jgi:hypothetical protein
MQVTSASEPGSPDKQNEDGLLVTAEMVAVLDGATVRTDTGCIHGVPWFVTNLAASLAKNRELRPADALTQAITETAAAHRYTCDLHHPATPSAALAIAQVQDNQLRYLVLGDVTLVVEANDGLRIVSDNRVNSTASGERQAADALPANSPEKAKALVRMKHAELAARNVPGGFWIAAAEPSVVGQSLTGEIPLKTMHRAVLLTDGATRAVVPFKIYDWSDLLSALSTEGPKELIRKVRIAEDADPLGLQQARNKVHDDATVAMIQF